MDTIYRKDDVEQEYSVEIDKGNGYEPSGQYFSSFESARTYCRNQVSNRWALGARAIYVKTEVSEFTAQPK